MRDIVGSSNFTVAKAPVCECTKAQLETVARIEDELGIPRNAFGLHTEVQKVFNRRMEAIKNACERSRVLEGVPDDLDYLMISGEWGQLMSPDYVQGNIGRFINWNGVFDRACENRDAQLIDSQLADDGVLEFLAYEKWGSANLNIRWRELHENESIRTVDESEKVSAVPADKDSLAALAAHFKRH